LSAVADIMDGVYKNNSIELTLACDGDIELYGIAGECSQVLLNLLSNAKDAVLTPRQAAPWVSVRATRVGARICIEVEDNGGGIAPALLEKIFEPYFTTKEEGKGAGIGLYLSKMIVENNLNGSLRVVNTAAGARFILEIAAA
jgi:C4-dicarboxylate-specific signal transduction histidine kinase